jgi:hypothetical protein
MSLFHGFGRFVKDMMSGGGDLNKHIVPGEIRKMAPKELQPGGFDPAKKWLGYDIKADPAHDAKIADRRETADALAAYNQGAPQFRGGQMGMSGPQQIQMLVKRGRSRNRADYSAPDFMRSVHTGNKHSNLLDCSLCKLRVSRTGCRNSLNSSVRRTLAAQRDLPACRMTTQISLSVWFQGATTNERRKYPIEDDAIDRTA